MRSVSLQRGQLIRMIVKQGGKRVNPNDKCRLVCFCHHFQQLIIAAQDLLSRPLIIRIFLPHQGSQKSLFLAHTERIGAPVEQLNRKRR